MSRRVVLAVGTRALSSPRECASTVSKAASRRGFPMKVLATRSARAFPAGHDGIVRPARSLAPARWFVPPSSLEGFHLVPEHCPPERDPAEGAPIRVAGPAGSSPTPPSVNRG